MSIHCYELTIDFGLFFTNDRRIVMYEVFVSLCFKWKYFAFPRKELRRIKVFTVLIQTLLRYLHKIVLDTTNFKKAFFVAFQSDKVAFFTIPFLIKEYCNSTLVIERLDGIFSGNQFMSIFKQLILSSGT